MRALMFYFKLWLLVLSLDFESLSTSTIIKFSSSGLHPVQGIFIEKYMGTKTTYNNRIRHKNNHDKDEAKDESKECEEDIVRNTCSNMTFVYYLGRHGTRYPTEKALQRMLKRGFDLGINMEDAGLLTLEGEKELYEIGKRFRERYNNTLVFPSGPAFGYHPKLYDFQSSQVTRALQSAHAFAIGLFERTGRLGVSNSPVVPIRSEDKSNDILLRFHKKCKRYKNEVKKNKKLKEEGHLAMLEKKHLYLGNFIDEFYKSRANLLKKHFAFSFDVEGNKEQCDESCKEEKVETLKQLWEACKTQVIVESDRKQTADESYPDYCGHYFDTDEIVSVLEYLDDAKAYWLKGPGFAVNSEMSCVLAAEIMEMIRSASENMDTFRGVFRFAHAETLLPIITKLELFKGDTDNIFKASADIKSPQVLNRHWRTSAISPKATNLIFEVHSCLVEDGSPKQFVRLLHNEQPISICGELDSGKLCPIESLEDLLGSQRCDFELLCQV